MANKNRGEFKGASIAMIPPELRPESVSVPIDNQPPQAPAPQQQPSHHQPHHQLASQLAAQNKRKEKARIAARARRSQEASIIMEMANELHITQEKVRKLDKATIVKLAIDYIKAFEILYRLRNAHPSSPMIASSSPSSLSSSSNGNDGNSCAASNNDINFDTSSYENGNNSNNIDDNNYSSSSGNESNDSNNMISTSNSNSSNERGIYDTKLSTSSIFTPKTEDMDSHFLMIDESDGRPSFVLKPDTEIADEDDLTHLAPQAGDVSISLEVESLEGIILDTELFGTSSLNGPILPPISLHYNDDSRIIISNKNMAPPTTRTMMMNTKDLIETCCLNNNSNNIGTVD